MHITRLHDAVMIRLDAHFSVLDAIALPGVIREQGRLVSVTLDFRDARWVRETALAVLIPALASMHRPPIRVVGLEGADEELTAAGIAFG